MNIRYAKQIYFRLPIIIRLLLTISILMLLFGLVIHFIEPAQFPTIFDGIWWAFVTGATVGYGDYVPLSTTGKIVAILLILTGGAFIAFYISSLSTAAFQHEQDLEKGNLSFKGNGHIIMIGWNERTRQLIEILLKNKPSYRIVLIDHSLRHISFQDFPVHFVQGNPTEDHTLEKANIKLADRVLITADISESERQADNMTILTTVAVRGNNKQIPIIAEILSKIQIENALRAGATTIVRSNDFMSTLFFHEISHLKKATPFEDIYQLLKTQQFYHTKIPDNLDDKPFNYISALHAEKEQILLGVIRNDQYHMNPPAGFRVKKGDILLSFINI
ncbi:potassium channel family protein [Virgibacillus sp. YIM 98842]|uniref:potassium channel family protein n=1 Tax=Virgibacillus sp. YIM 98842 TaxID=2663533 RepID=UPI0013D91671|nr:potassium channel family protein [Virgibacillus sp. YIM 98842]